MGRVKRIANEARVAVGTLTALPVRAEWDDDAGRRALAFYPAVGWLIGLAGVSLPLLLALAGWRGKANALVGVLVLVVLEGAARAMHYDALADTADAFFGSPDIERRLEIMKDSLVGALGAAAIAIAIAAQAASLTGVIEVTGWYAIVIAMVVGRFGSALALWSIRPARPDGMAASVAGRPALATVLGALLFIALLGLLPFVTVAEGWRGVALSAAPFGGWAPHAVRGFWLSLGVALACAVGLPRLLARPVGGITGDLLGASLVIGSILTFSAAALFG
jgi:adenosylcobinamide-GDP ribazoletransferase